jgi:hypothetical protein
MRRIAASLVVATVAGMSSMVGLAYAGVGLPPPAVAAFDKIGISLPNQAGSADSGQPGSLPSASQHGQDVKAIATAGPGGCAFGQAVAATASSKRQDAKAASHRKDAGHRPADVCDQAKGAGGTTSAGGPSIGQGHSPGYGKDNHPSGSSATGEQTNPTGNGTSTNPTRNGKDNHPSDQASGTSTNPTGNGETSHPSDSTSGQASNPTGFGETSHPSDRTTGRAGNPTGYGPGNHPG